MAQSGLTSLACNSPPGFTNLINHATIVAYDVQVQSFKGKPAGHMVCQVFAKSACVLQLDALLAW